MLRVTILLGYSPFGGVLSSLQKSEEVKFFTDQVRRALGSGGCSID